MLRSLAILTVTVFMSIGVSGQPDEAANPKQQGAKQSQPAIHSPYGKDKQSGSETDQHKPGGNPPAGNTPVKGPIARG